MKNIVLTGFMGTGKSTIGALLAKKLGRRFIDIDALITERENRTIPDIFEQSGEAYFRRLEKSIIAEVSKLSNCVIATGGGAVLDKENIDNLREKGIIVNLHASARVIAERTGKSDQRPLLSKKSEEQIARMLAEREKLYADNDFSVLVDGQSPLVTADKIISTYKKLA